MAQGATMSIINSVLKDIDNQHKSFQQHAVAPGFAGEAHTHSRKNYSLYIGVLAAVFLAVIAFQAYLSSTSINTVASIDAIAPVTSKLENTSEIEKVSEIIPSQPALDQPLKDIKEANLEKNSDEIIIKKTIIVEVLPNRLKGFEINELDSGLELAFKLDKEPVSYIKSYSKGRSVYHLADVSNRLEVPQIENKQWLKTLLFINIDDGLDIVIESTDKTLLKTKWEVTEQSGSRWVISLSKQKEPKIVPATRIISQPNAKIETPKSEPLKANHEVKQSVDVAPKAKQVIETNKLKSKPVTIEITAKNQIGDSQYQMNKAILALEQKEYKRTEIILKSLIGSDLDLNARKTLIKLYRQTRNINLANQWLNESLVEYPNETELNYQVARQYYNVANFNQVIKLLSPIKNKSYQIYALMGQSHQRLAQHQPAITTFQQSLKLKPQPHLWVSMALSYEKLKRYQQALISYEQALKRSISDKLRRFSELRKKQIQGLVNQPLDQNPA